MKKLVKGSVICAGVLIAVLFIVISLLFILSFRSEQEVSLHPYVGYVLNPNYQKDINRLGFRGKLPDKNSAGYKVGIFGGSVAYMYAISEGDNLQRFLASNFNKSPHEIEIYSFAIPGHKQPQQLMTLAYLYSLGYTFDLVINIDGFNEAVLSYTESYKQGVTSYYPRNWHTLSRNFVRGNSLIYTRLIIGLSHLQRYLFQFEWGRNMKVRSLVINLHNGLTSLLQRSLLREQAQYQTSGPDLFADVNDKRRVEDVIIDIWAQSSIQMNNLSKVNGARYIEILHPNQYIKGSKPLSDAEKKYFVKQNHPYAKPASTIYPELVKKAAVVQTRGVTIVDATALFQHNRETVYVDDCCHYNRVGYTRLSEILFPYISEN